MGHFQQELLHVPRAGRTAFGAEPTVQADVLVLDHHPSGRQVARDEQRLLQVQDRIIRQFPEVDRVLGKAGRADTSTDPAPFSMMETVIVLKPHNEWRRVDTWYSEWALASKGVTGQKGAPLPDGSKPLALNARFPVDSLCKK